MDSSHADQLNPLISGEFNVDKSHHAFAQILVDCLVKQGLNG